MRPSLAENAGRVAVGPKLAEQAAAVAQLDADGRNVVGVLMELGADVQRIGPLAADHQQGQVFAVVRIAHLDDLAIVLDLTDPAAVLLPLLDDLGIPVLDENPGRALGRDDRARGAQAIDDVGGRPDEGHGIFADLASDERARALGIAGLDGDAHMLQIIGDAGDRRSRRPERSGSGPTARTSSLQLQG